MAVGKSQLIHVELPSWKILLLGPLAYREDYRRAVHLGHVCMILGPFLLITLSLWPPVNI